MALVPLRSLFMGDFLVLLVPVDDQDTIEVVGQKIAYHTLDRRLTPKAKNAPIEVRFKGEIVPSSKTVAEAGIGPMDYVEAAYSE